MKRVVVLGGGTGNSAIMKGLKNFPIDLTTIVSVCDNGSSTGKLREEINMPAVGDIRKIILALSEDNPLKDILNYRIDSKGELNNHSIGNILLTGIYQNNDNNLYEATNVLRSLFNIKSKILPLSEDNLTLIAKTKDNNIIIGEAQITDNNEEKKSVYYNKNATVLEEVITALKEADLIVIAPGSLWTSILPVLICEDIKNILKTTKAKIMYICNIMTQPGETIDYTAGDHVKTINKHIGANVIDSIIVNNQVIDDNILKTYKRQEDKDLVKLDYDELTKLNLNIIEDKLIDLSDGTLKHNPELLSFLIYSYLIRL